MLTCVHALSCNPLCSVYCGQTVLAACVWGGMLASGGIQIFNSCQVFLRQGKTPANNQLSQVQLDLSRIAEAKEPFYLSSKESHVPRSTVGRSMLLAAAELEVEAGGGGGSADAT